jgi:hypothetical protein
MRSIRAIVRGVLEKLFRTQTSTVIGSCIAVWAGSSRDVSDEAIFDCIDTLTPSAQRVVEIVSEGIKQGRASDQGSVVSSFCES